MTEEHKKSLAKHLSDAGGLFETCGYTHVSVMMTKEELDYMIGRIRYNSEPTHEEVMEYCKRRNLYLITDEAFERLTHGGEVKVVIE